MKREWLLRLGVLLTLFSFTLVAGPIDLLQMTPSIVGDVSLNAGIYTDFLGSLGVPGHDHPPVPWAATQTVVGGNFDSATSLAVSATDRGILTHDALGNPTSLTVPVLENTLGLLTSDLDALLLDPTLGVANGSAMYWPTVTVNAGDTISLAVRFVSNDGLPFDDFSFFAALGPGTKSVQLLNRVDAAQPGGVGDFWSSSYHGFSYTFPTAGTFLVALGVVNVGPFNGFEGVPLPVIPNAFDFDPLSTNYFNAPLQADSALLIAPVPEPAAWFLAGSALAIAALLRRRRRAN